MLIIGVSVAVAVVVGYFCRHFVGAMFGLYRIVPVNEAHIRVMNNHKDVFSARTGKSAYWYIPFMTKVNKLPLSNLSIPVNDIKLNDKDMAKFICDMVCFVNIKDVEKAAERLVLSAAGSELGFNFQKLSEDLRAIMESIGRTVATKQTILDIYRDRSSLDKTITEEVSKVFPEWGLQLVDLELKDLKDAEDSTVIHDIETLKAAEIRRDAEIRKAETERAARVKRAEEEETARRSELEKDRKLALQQQKIGEEVAVAAAITNKKRIEAERELQIGSAEIARQVQEKTSEGARIKLRVEAEGFKEKLALEAEGQKQKLMLEAEGEAKKVQAVGEAEANVILMKKEADATGTEKLAVAMAKFNDAAMGVKTLEAQVDVAIAKANAYANALSNADLKLILSGANASKFFGLTLDAENGAMLSQFADESGISLESVKKLVDSIKATGKKE